MSKTVVVFGSSTGTCEAIAEKIGAKLGAEVVNVQDLNGDVLAADNILLGTSTWGAGELQDDWYDGLGVVKGTDLSGKTVAIFGCGDSASYGDTFCSAMKELYDAAKAAGANVALKFIHPVRYVSRVVFILIKLIFRYRYFFHKLSVYIYNSKTA